MTQDNKVSSWDLNSLMNVMEKLTSFLKYPPSQGSIGSGSPVELFQFFKTNLKANLDSQKPFKENLTLKERFRLTKISCLYLKAEYKYKTKPAEVRAEDITDICEALSPLLKKSFGAETVVQSLRYTSTKSSIALLRSLGANETADLCQKAKDLTSPAHAKADLEKIAKRYAAFKKPQPKQP